MTTKDSALFESRPHNFNVLISSGEESDTESAAVHSLESSEGSTTGAAAVNGETENVADDGFETFTSARKTKGPKKSSTVTAQEVRPAHVKTPFPKELIRPCPETSIELYEFPSTHRTNDLRKFLQAFDGHYRLKWNNDTSCYVVFDDAALVGRAMNELKDENIKIRNYVEPVDSAATTDN